MSSRKRGGMEMLYIGDIGEIPEKFEKVAPPKDINYDELTFRELFNIGLAAGIPVQKMIGIKYCYEHIGMKPLGNNKIPDGHNLADDCNYCNNCYTMFIRIRKIAKKAGF